MIHESIRSIRTLLLDLRTVLTLQGRIDLARILLALGRPGLCLGFFADLPHDFLDSLTLRAVSTFTPFGFAFGRCGRRRFESHSLLIQKEEAYPMPLSFPPSVVPTLGLVSQFRTFLL